MEPPFQLPWYDQERADEAAMALLWLGVEQVREDTFGARPEISPDILKRLQERGYVRPGADGKLIFTDLGRVQGQMAFVHLLGTPVAAEIQEPPTTHVVEEVDGD